MWNHKGGSLRGNGKYAEPRHLLLALESFYEPWKGSESQINEFSWNQIKNYVSPSNFFNVWIFGGGVDWASKGLEALECELSIILQWFTSAGGSQDEK